MRQETKDKIMLDVPISIFLLFVIGPAFAKWRWGDPSTLDVAGVPFPFVLLLSVIAGGISARLEFGKLGNKTGTMILGGLYGGGYFAVVTWWLRGRPLMFFIELFIIAIILLIPAKLIWEKWCRYPPADKEQDLQPPSAGIIGDRDAPEK